MPRGNKKGPMGEGPNTGRGLGYCTGHDEPGCDADGPRRGGAGRGLGRGRGQGGRGMGGRGMGRSGMGRGGSGRGAGRGMGLGNGRGMGLGRGLGRGLPANHHDQEELSSLRRRVQELEARVAESTEES